MSSRAMACTPALRERPPQGPRNSSNMSITGFGSRIRDMGWAAAITTTKISTTESGRKASDTAMESTFIGRGRGTSAPGSKIGEKGPMDD
jgi:hypothetical protein